MVSTQALISSTSPTRTPANEILSIQQKQQSDTKESFYQVPVQRKLSVGAADDPLEKEADDMADKVMRMPNPEPISFSSSKNVINRKCSECEKEVELQKKESNGEAVSTAPSIVQDVLSSPGRSLDTDTRSFMEPRFNYNFNNVKIHDDDLAAKSASSINALAYTSGNNVVFNTGQYNTKSDPGKRLLAHELTHVVQQDNIIHEKIQRRVASRLTLCSANTAGTTADPVADLGNIDARARDMATQISQSLATDATTALSGVPATPSVTFQSYITNFGLPNAVGSRFQNRLTGNLVATQEVAMNQELNILSRRFALVANLFGQFVNYICSDLGQTRSFGGCSNGPCDQGDAWSCRGIGAIFLCPSFWDPAMNDDQRASILIHEAFHIILGPTNPREVGQIGDETLNGPGRNFNIAGCYEQMIPDFFGFGSVATCPAPGT